MKRQNAGILFRAALLTLILPVVANADPVTVFSGSGFVTPETITSIPAGFGTVGGNYFVPDSSANELFVLPIGGGAPTAFASLASAAPDSISGTFVPSGYGSLSGQFLVTGNGNSAVVSSAGVVTKVSLSNLVEGSAVAPSGFGSVGGKVLLGNVESNGTVDILVLNANGTTSVFATIGTQNSSGSPNPFTLGFAPSGFGSSGGDLIVTDGSSGKIYTISSSGHVSVFTTIPTPTVPGEVTGLRQFSFAPTGYGAYSGDLFLSVSGSQNGGGTLGSLDVLNESGTIIANLKDGTVGSPYDARGLYFVNSNQLLVADTDPGILSVAPNAFTSVTPEPSSITLLLLGISGIAGVRMRGRHAKA